MHKSQMFRQILVTLDNEPDAYELLDCMKELRLIYEKLGADHQYSVFAQVFDHKESEMKFYLTGKILTPSQGLRIKQILAEEQP